jgi:DNA sulfur modification protein DndD
MNANSIDYIINHRKVCICGTTIAEGSAAYKCLLTERAKLPPESIGSLVRSYRERAMEYLSFTENYHSNVEKEYKNFRADQREVGFRKEELEKLAEKLSGKKDIKDIESSYKNADSRCKSLERDKESLILKIGGYKKDIDNFEKSLISYTKANEKNAKVAACINYSTEVFDWIRTSYQTKEQTVRSSLEVEVNEKFSRMYHGNRTILIDEKYRVKYLDVTTEESDGLKAVKSFAFIAGLVELAKKALDSKDDADADIGPQYYPLVMDAPFSNLDEIHIENICNIIPMVAEQVIIAVMQKDWGYAEDAMSQYVGCSYDILKDSEPDGSTIETMTHIVRKEN